MDDSNKTSQLDLAGLDDTCREVLDLLCYDLLATLDAFEITERQFDPGIVSYLQEKLSPFADRLEGSGKQFHSIFPPSDFKLFHDQLKDATINATDALRIFVTPAGLEASLINFRKAKRKICRTREKLFSLRRSLPTVNRFLIEAAVHERIDEFDPDRPPRTDVGLFHVGMEEDPYARGRFSLYVPESYGGYQAWPLVIALHGGFSHGRDFLWTWFREARSRRFILLAPSSHEATWSITGIDVDSATLNKMLEYVAERWKIDKNRILLTGISDGATYALSRALDKQPPFTAFAPVSGVLPPFDLRNAKDRRIYWVHGAFDWMFPVERARQDYTILKTAGADITLRVIDDLSHTYPREQNDRILTWFDSSLALPTPKAAKPQIRNSNI